MLEDDLLINFGGDLVIIVGRLFVLKFNKGWFEKGDVISNETLHYIDEQERWEMQMVREMKSYQNKDGEEWNRERFWKFLSTKKGWERTIGNDTKISRFISKCKSWGLITKLGHNQYLINDTEIFE